MDRFKIQLRESKKKLLVDVTWGKPLHAEGELQIDQEVGLPAVLKLLSVDSYDPEQFTPKERLFLGKLGLVTKTPDGPVRSDRLEELLGECLFRQLFPDEHTRGLFYEARRESRTGIDLALELDPTSTVAAQLPWELAWSSPDFLTLGGQGTLSRRLVYDGRNAITGEVTFDKLRVLIISPRPNDQRFDDLGDAEAEALEQLEGLEITRLEPPTIQRLGAYIDELGRDGAPHVLHFDGHGAFGRICRKCGWVSPRLTPACRSCNTQLSGLPQGYLAMEGINRALHFVSASDVALQLGMALSDPECPMRLVVLSACRSATAIGGESEFSGVAQRIMTTGMPAVVAMKYPVEATATTAFSRRLYSNLVNGKSLSDAIRRARADIKLNGSGQWYRPVLYLDVNADEGHFFRRIATVPPRVSILGRHLPNGHSSVDDVKRVDNALKLVAHSTSRDDRLRAAVLSFRAAFAHCQVELARLGDYKSIHDRLHSLNFWYGLVVPEVEREGGPSLKALRLYGDELGNHIAGLEQLRDRGNVSNREFRWMSDLTSARVALRQIADTPGARTNTYALERLGSTLAAIPAEINASLDYAAQNLQLGDVELALRDWRQIAAARGQPGTDQDQVTDGLQSLGRLRATLSSLITEHGLRQELERQIRLVRSTGIRDVARFAAYVWPDLSEQLKPAEVAGLETKAQALLVELSRLTAVLTTHNAQQVDEQFENCVSAADDYFYSLDLQVKRLCEQLSALGDALGELVAALDPQQWVAA